MESVLIVGCGVFGLSTALELAEKGYQVTAIDAYEVPSPWSAAADYNKIIRTEYNDIEYTKLSVEAVKQWRSNPIFKGTYNECGRVLITPELHEGRKKFELDGIKNLQSIKGEGTKIQIFKGGNKLAQIFSELRLNTVEENVELKWNPETALGHAAKSLTAVYKQAEAKGVKFIFGSKGEARRVVVQGKNELIETVDGTQYTADKIIISAGAASGKLIDLKQQQSATALFVTHLKLTEKEFEQYKNLPIVFDSYLGYFFPPDPDTRVMKIALPGSGASHFVTDPFDGSKQQSLPRYKPQNPNDTMPRSGLTETKKLLGKYVPELAYHRLFGHKACWIADTSDSHFIIDKVPAYNKILVASGDSGHGFKLLPIIGKYIVKRLQNTLDPKLADIWRWKEDKEAFDLKNCEWRVTTDVLDLKHIDWAEETYAKL